MRLFNLVSELIACLNHLYLQNVLRLAATICVALFGLAPNKQDAIQTVSCLNQVSTVYVIQLSQLQILIHKYVCVHL